MKQTGAAPNVGSRRSLPPLAKAPRPDSDLMEVDEERPNRERADRAMRQRLEEDQRRIEARFQDGRYGFPERSDQERLNGRRDEDRGGLYSDNMVRRPYRQ